MDLNLLADEGWASSACTLPTAAQTLRVAEFDEFFGHDVIGVARPTSHQLRLELRADSATAARAASLAVRETECCAFFRFELAIVDGTVGLTVRTTDAHTDVLAALGDRAEALIGGKTT